jgi:hypothetical protein
MLYTVFVAVCLTGTPVRDCDRHSAVSWIAAPEQQQGLGACMLHGMEYVSQAPGLIRNGVYPIRSLIDEIRLVPADGALRIEIKGELAGVLELCEAGANQKSGGLSTAGLAEQIKMVAR